MNSLTIRHRLLVPALVLGLCAPLQRAHAQAPPLTVPGGALRIELAAGMDSWDDVLPGPGSPVALDEAQASRLTGSLGIALGLTSRFTLFGSAPFERVRVQAVATDPDVSIPDDRAAGPGDMAVGLAWRVLGAAADVPGDHPRLETAVSARLPTGRVLRRAEHYTLTAGDGQTDVELAGRVYLPGGRIGIRLDGAYVVPFGEAHSGAELDPYFSIGATPWLKLGRSLALEIGAQRLVRDDADGGGATAVGGGLAFFAPLAWRDGGRSLPLAASWRVMKVIAAPDGAPEPLSVSAGIQLYFGLFR